MTSEQPINPSRRRLAKGALASSAVLASLTAKDALATGTNITCSGKMSGNLSNHQHATTDCRDKGHSNWHWRNNVYTSHNTRKLPSFLGNFYGKGSGASAQRSATRVNSSWSPLTCHQLLWGRNAGTPIPDVDFVVKTLCVYLNAEMGNYYVTPTEVMSLYQSATTGIGWQRPSSGSRFMNVGAAAEADVWGPEESQAYIELLYFPT